MVITAALVIILSAFNGIEKMIEKMYSEFDSDITIVAKDRKRFQTNELNWKLLEKNPDIRRFSKAIEEMVVLRHEKKWVNATLIGFEPNYLQSIEINEHLWAGNAQFQEGKLAYGIIGVGLTDKLQLAFSKGGSSESILLYVPKRNVKIGMGRSPFFVERVLIAGAMNYNREVNEDKLLWPLEKVQQLLNDDQNLTHVYIEVKEDTKKNTVKTQLQQQLGSTFEVKTNFEKNELIFQTSQSEKMVVIVILIFVFVLASFNLVASLTMLYIEKESNLKTLLSIGLSEKDIFRLFFYEGLLISGIGIGLGLSLGYLLCWLQIQFHLFLIPGPNTPFPMRISLGDFLTIFLSVSSLSVLFSYIPTYFLVRKRK